jgi:hypothetical protein
LLWDRRRGGRRDSLRGGRGCEIEFDLDWFARFGFREHQDPAEEAVPNSIAMQSRGAEQANPIGIAFYNEGSNPRIDDEGGYLRLETANDIVPEHGGGAHVPPILSIYSTNVPGFPRKPPRREAQ